MPKLPAVSGLEIVKALRKCGFVEVRQRGSHVTMARAGTGSVVVVPVHSSKDLPAGTLAAILRGAGLTADELLRLLS